jgi:hypothetical protein
VGHPKGYIGSDVFARTKRMQGYNVLHPMGYDAFGLPAEQYAIEHNINPAQAVKKNVETFERQLSIIGLSYDWDRRVNTTDPSFYKWTQWIFLKIYNSWYNPEKNKAEPITTLIKIFNKKGNLEARPPSGGLASKFSAKEWKIKSKKEKQDILMKYRLAYEGYAEVNWCPQLGTVLANDEVVDGKDGGLALLDCRRCKLCAHRLDLLFATHTGNPRRHILGEHKRQHNTRKRHNNKRICKKYQCKHRVFWCDSNIELRKQRSAFSFAGTRSNEWWYRTFHRCVVLSINRRSREYMAPSCHLLPRLTYFCRRILITLCISPPHRLVLHHHL